jgi:hypothetical protein
MVAQFRKLGKLTLQNFVKKIDHETDLSQIQNGPLTVEMGSNR